MQTTITLDDALAEAIRRRAAEEDLTPSAFIERLLQAALTTPSPHQPPAPFRPVTFKGNGLCPGVDLDRMAQVLEEEDAHMLDKAGR